MLERFRGGIDLCFIPTGIHLHAPMAIAALEAGANVLLEKPVAGTVQEVRAIREAAERAGRFVAVGSQLMYDPATLRMKEALLDGSLGELRIVKARGCEPRTAEYYNRNRWAGRLRTDEGTWVLDSPVQNANAHQVILACFLAGTDLRSAGEITHVTAELYRAAAPEGPDTASIRAETKGGVPVVVNFSHASLSSTGTLVLAECTKGRAYRVDNFVCIERADGSRETFSTKVGEMYESMLARVRERIEDPGGFILDLEIAGAQTRLVNGAHLSCPVRDISNLEGRVFTRDGHTWIRYIERAMLSAHERGLLLDESGQSWTTPGERVSVGDLEAFEGGKTGR
jgi:predicted dehydrogenase